MEKIYYIEDIQVKKELFKDYNDFYNNFLIDNKHYIDEILICEYFNKNEYIFNTLLEIKEFFKYKSEKLKSYNVEQILFERFYTKENEEIGFFIKYKIDTNKQITIPWFYINDKFRNRKFGSKIIFNLINMCKNDNSFLYVSVNKENKRGMKFFDKFDKNYLVINKINL